MPKAIPVCTSLSEAMRANHTWIQGRYIYWDNLTGALASMASNGTKLPTQTCTASCWQVSMRCQRNACPSVHLLHVFYRDIGTDDACKAHIYRSVGPRKHAHILYFIDPPGS